MRLKFDIELELSARQKRMLAVCAAAAIVLSSSAAWAALPRTFVQGTTLKAGDLNANFAALDERLAALENQSLPRSRVAVKGLLPYNVPTQTVGKLSFATDHYDDLEQYDAASSTFTAGTDGDYEVCLTANGSGAGWVELYVEGVSRGWLLKNETWSNGCRTLRVEAGEVLDLRLSMVGYSSTATGGDNEAWLTINQLD